MLVASLNVFERQKKSTFFVLLGSFKYCYSVIYVPLSTDRGSLVLG